MKWVKSWKYLGKVRLILKQTLSCATIAGLIASYSSVPVALGGAQKEPRTQGRHGVIRDVRHKPQVDAGAGLFEGPFLGLPMEMDNEYLLQQLG